MEALRRPALPEVAVRSRLFAAAAAAGPGGEALLRRCAELTLVRLAPLLAACVWQRQPFRLRYVPGRGEIPAHLGGTAEFGDNVEDEWFIVYLLREMSRELPGLAASIDDNDGEFLLIEAADFLPKWLNPESSENREWPLCGIEFQVQMAQTNAGKSFSSHKRGASSVGAAPCESAGPDCGAEAAELAALDVDMNLVAKLLESYSAQAGLAGPTSSILQSLGVNLPESSELTGS
ncbi:protein ecdysoneless homolog [Melospiza melodia melodia]|uniref:protein ecdysoneless homolog n=1 Tax=Melospiza melodia melodia TaxID=1914991 RepID=UPI002FD23571